ncbi:MAG: spondin domain-containing protein [Gammaproteobacteria bacterium]|nr:spondin domain-containing protein [Gammaproteobacteria bacterium]MDH5729119.1 spondin domain-containing protein [Gammaproteobacteria bacterium]
MMNLLKPMSIVCITAFFLSACFHNQDDDAMQEHTMMYQISVSNLSNNQALTPPAVVLHNENYSAWRLGMTASTALEKLAEGGDTTDFISDANANSAVAASQVLSNSPIGPGSSAQATIEISHVHELKLSVATMLANSNDAFTGVNSLDISSLAMNESLMIDVMVFDAGSELNSESAGTIPGPVDGGTGFDASRDDIVNFISIHPGVVSMDDGLASSVLDESHRWNGSVAQIKVTRLQ